MNYKYIDEKKEHLHTLDGKPLIGTSSVGSVIAKPLTYWASGLAVMQLGVPDAKVLTKVKNKKASQDEIDALYRGCDAFLEDLRQMDTDSYVKLMGRAYTAHATTLKDKAEEGTDLHAELERFVKWFMIKGDQFKDTISEEAMKFEPRIKPFIDWSNKNVKRFLWSEAHCFSEKMWTGGISDVGAELNDGKIIVIDFKSSKEAYLGQFWQCVGYAIQIEENGWFDRNGNQLGTLDKPIDYVCIVPFGAPKVEPQFNYDMAGGRDAFIAELVLYKKLNV